MAYLTQNACCVYECMVYAFKNLWKPPQAYCKIEKKKKAKLYGCILSVISFTANSATVAAGGLFFVSYTPYYFSLLWYESVSLAGKISIGLFCHNTAMGYGGLLIALFEGTGQSKQLSFHCHICTESQLLKSVLMRKRVEEGS